jgi:hypothetical protein
MTSCTTTFGWSMKARQAGYKDCALRPYLCVGGVHIAMPIGDHAGAERVAPSDRRWATFAIVGKTIMLRMDLYVRISWAASGLA